MKIKNLRKYFLPLIIIIILTLLKISNNQKIPSNDNESTNTNINNNTEINKNNTDTDNTNSNSNTDTNNNKTDTYTDTDTDTDNNKLNNNTDSNNNDNNNTDKNNSETNTDIYDAINDHSIESDNLEIKFYKSNTTSRSKMVKNYKSFIELKDEFYRNTFKPFNYKYMPENKEYKKTIYKLSDLWFVMAGLVGIFFILYIILRFFFGKFKGAKEDNLHPDDKWLPWGLFSKRLKKFLIFLKFFFNFS